MAGAAPAAANAKHVGVRAVAERHPLGYGRSRGRVPARRRAERAHVGQCRRRVGPSGAGRRPSGPWALRQAQRSQLRPVGERARGCRGDRASCAERPRRDRHVARWRHDDSAGGDSTRSRAPSGRDRRHAIGQQGGSCDDRRAALAPWHWSVDRRPTTRSRTSSR